MEKVLALHSLLVNDGPCLPMNHPENNLVFTDQLFKLLTGPASHSHTGLSVPEIANKLEKPRKAILNTTKIVVEDIL